MKQKEKEMTLSIVRMKEFKNGKVYAMRTEDGYKVETTDTFLPYYTKNAIGRKQNCLDNEKLGNRNERWMIGVSTMSGCPVGCKFCATAKLKKCRNLTADEIVEQVKMILELNRKDGFTQVDAKEFKINYTRMGEPFLNIDNVREAIKKINKLCFGKDVHHYISTIGIKGADYSWIKDDITLQFSVHSFNEEHRDWLIPFPHKATLEELGNVRTGSRLKTTINLTLVDETDFNIDLLKKWFDPTKFFVKLSPINKNETSEKNNLGDGIIKGKNLI